MYSYLIHSPEWNVNVWITSTSQCASKRWKWQVSQHRKTIIQPRDSVCKRGVSSKDKHQLTQIQIEINQIEKRDLLSLVGISISTSCTRKVDATRILYCDYHVSKKVQAQKMMLCAKGLRWSIDMEDGWDSYYRPDITLSEHSHHLSLQGYNYSTMAWLQYWYSGSNRRLMRATVRSNPVNLKDMKKERPCGIPNSVHFYGKK